jgi:hypothetical protein
MDFEIFCHPEVSIKNMRDQVDFKKSHPDWGSEIEDSLSMTLLGKLRNIT